MQTLRRTWNALGPAPTAGPGETCRRGGGVPGAGTLFPAPIPSDGDFALGMAGSLPGWSVPGEWPDREVTAPDHPTLALPDSCRVLPSEPPRDLFAGWDRFADLELVGIGGMGRVYRARDPHRDREVALKFVVEGRRRAEPGHRQREAELQSRVDHPGVLPVLDRGELHGYPWFSMPFVEGRTLKAARRQRRPDLDEAVAVLVEVAWTVQAIHEGGIAHCDLNPRNVLLAGRGGRPFVIDFGIAREIEPAGSPATAPGRVVGTPSYMAPEQALGRRHLVSPATDVYALGATLYELVAGKRPFAADTCEAIITKAIREAPEPLRGLNADVPPSLERVVLRCLEKDPLDRYPSAAALAEALEGCQAGH